MTLIEQKQYDVGVAAESVQARATPRHEPLMLGSGLLDSFLLQLRDDSATPIPAWWSRERDLFLRQAVRKSAILSSVNWGRVSQVKNAEWRLELKSDAASEDLAKFNDMFGSANFGAGFRTFLELYTQDMYIQDNGAFIEFLGEGEEKSWLDSAGTVVKAKGVLQKKDITGFAHLDAAQCWRTNNPEFPVIYTDPWTGQRHILHWTRVSAKAQFQQSLERGRGIGLCAVSRAFMFAEIVKTSDEYLLEKMTGQAPEIGIVSGLSVSSLRDAILSADIENDARGRVRYKGISFVAADNVPGVNASIDRVGLREIPDGWDRTAEVNLAMHLIAVAYATDVRDLGFPAQSMGQTKADAEIQDLKTTGRGRADVLRDLTEIFNTRLLPKGISFVFDNKDDLEDRRRAEIKDIRVSTRAAQIKAGELTVQEARIIAAQEGDIKPEFLEAPVIANTEEIEPEEDAQPLPEIETKDSAYPGLRQRYKKRMFTIVNRLRRTGDIDTFFGDAFTTVRGFGRKAYLQGIRDGGAPGIRRIRELEPEEQAEALGLVSDQIGFLSNLSAAVEKDKLARYEAIRQRVELWANKGLDGIYEAGKLAGAANRNLMWKLGATEKHCTDCQRLDGRVYRAKTWKKWGIRPRLPELECGGWKCDCKFEATMEKCTPGRPPKLSGG